MEFLLRYYCPACNEMFEYEGDRDEARWYTQCKCGCQAEFVPEKAPGLAGVETGPGSCNNEVIFDRPDPMKDGLKALRAMEEGGKLKDPETAKWARVKWEQMKQKSATFKKVDYQKGGHPLEGLNR